MKFKETINHDNQKIKAKVTLRLLKPHYWINWLWFGILYVLVLLPYPIIYKLGKFLGILFYIVITKRRKIAGQNIKLCFPDMQKNEQKKLLKENFISSGIAIFETGMAWFWSDHRIKKHVKIKNASYIDDIKNDKKGILLISLHFLSIELNARFIGIHFPAVGVYRPNDNPVIEYMQLKGRLKSNKYMIDRYDTKSMILALKNGEILWYAPDHDYGYKNSVFVPFFAVEKAATTVGTTFLIKVADPVVISFTSKRLKNGQYDLKINQPIENYPKDNKIAAATFMNKVIENQILKAPEQYMWMHRRFKTRPYGEKSLYSPSIQNH